MVTNLIKNVYFITNEEYFINFKSISIPKIIHKKYQSIHHHIHVEQLILINQQVMQVFMDVANAF